MLTYLDSSALVKKYFYEYGTDTIQSVWKESQYLAISQVGYSEILATIGKKQRMDGFSDKVKNSLILSFKEDWKSLIKINVDPVLNSKLDTIHSAHFLRGFDAIHLVSAKILCEESEEEFLFLSADENLNLAAKKEGLETGNYTWKL